jgi:hypothetical protein
VYIVCAESRREPRGLQFRDLAWEVLMPASGWLFQAVASVILAVFVFGVAWLIFASVKGFFDGMTRGLRGDDVLSSE